MTFGHHIQNTYQPVDLFTYGRLTCADKAIKRIRQGERVFIGSACGEPQHLVRSLAENAVKFSADNHAGVLAETDRREDLDFLDITDLVLSDCKNDKQLHDDQS